MIEWNRNVASVIQILLMLSLFILLLIKRKKLGKGIVFLIIASISVFCIDLFLFLIHFKIPRFNGVPIYTIGTNFFVFFLFLVVLLHVLVKKQYSKLQKEE